MSEIIIAVVSRRTASFIFSSLLSLVSCRYSVSYKVTPALKPHNLCKEKGMRERRENDRRSTWREPLFLVSSFLTPRRTITQETPLYSTTKETLKEITTYGEESKKEERRWKKERKGRQREPPCKHASTQANDVSLALRCALPILACLVRRGRFETAYSVGCCLQLLSSRRLRPTAAGA